MTPEYSIVIIIRRPALVTLIPHLPVPYPLKLFKILYKFINTTCSIQLRIMYFKGTINYLRLPPHCPFTISLGRIPLHLANILIWSLTMPHEDCPSDYPWCRCAYVVFGSSVGEPEQLVWLCANQCGFDGCVPDCTTCLCGSGGCLDG